MSRLNLKNTYIIMSILTNSMIEFFKKYTDLNNFKQETSRKKINNNRSYHVIFIVCNVFQPENTRFFLKNIPQKELPKP